MLVDEPSPSQTPASNLVSDEDDSKEIAEPCKLSGPCPMRLKEIKILDERVREDCRKEVNQLIILSSVFSYYAAFVAVTSYVLTYETPTNALARLQLREMLAVTNDPAIDRLAPATFKPTLPLVLATALFSVSLALKLATFFIGIFCKLWLHEYEKCGSLEAKKSCLLRGLGFPGLRAWPVDRIILEFLPKLFTVAMVLNIIGLLFLFWPFHPVMGVIVAAMVGFIVTSIAGLRAVLTLNPPFKSRSKRG